jgi:hypothetical protein
MSKPSRIKQLILSITEDVVKHPKDLTRYYMGALNISRVGANNYIQQLEELGWIARSGPSTRTHSQKQKSFQRNFTNQKQKMKVMTCLKLMG